MYQLLRFHINDNVIVIGTNLTKEKAEAYAVKLNKKLGWMEYAMAVPME